MYMPNRTFFQRVTAYAAFSGRRLRILVANGSSDGRTAM